MADSDAAAERGGFSVRLAVFYAALFAAFGVQLPFFPLWLGAKGLDARWIGIVLAIPMVVRMFAIPFAAHQADHREALRGTLIAASAATACAYFVVGWTDSLAAIVLSCAVAAAVYAPLMPLTDAYALKGLNARGRAYGPVRLWGSAAFIAGTFIAGVAINYVDPTQLIWLVTAGSAATAVAAVFLLPLGRSDVPVTTGATLSLLRNRGAVVVIIAASLVQASHAVYYGFSVILWSSAGLSGPLIALLWALGVVSEIVLFAVSAKLPKRLTPLLLLTIGGAGGALRWAIMAFDPPAAALPFLQCLHAASFGCTHLGALNYLTGTVSPSLTARAQGTLSIALGLAMAASMALSGVLFAAYEGIAYAAMAVLALAGAAFAFAAHRRQDFVVPSH